MNRPAIVFDSGALDRCVTDREFRAMLEELLRAGWMPIVPTPVLAEAITGRPSDAPTNLAVRRMGTTPTDEALARLAGSLRHDATRDSARRTPSAIDAIVAAHAVDEGRGVVVTADPRDLRRLLAGQPQIRVERP